MVGLEVLAEGFGGHPGIVGFPEHMGVAFGAGGRVRVGESAEIDPVPVPGGFARGNGHCAGDTSEYHFHAFTVDQFCSVFGAPGRFATGVSDHQLQLPAINSAGLVDFVNSQKGTQALLQPLILITSGLWVVQADLEGFGIDSGCLLYTSPSPRD